MKLPTQTAADLNGAVLLFVALEAALVGTIVFAVFSVFDPSPLAFGLLGIALTILVALPVNIQSCRSWTKLLDANQKLVLTSVSDPLTRLANRRAFSERMEKIGSRAAVLAVVDIDRFKQVNDSFGHACGDDILVQVSDILAFALDGPGTVYRMGGDEFAIVSEELDSDGLSAILDRTRESIAKSRFQTVSGPVRITISCGISFRRPGQTAQELYRAADAALYGAKLAGRNHVWTDSPNGNRIVPETVGDDLEWRPAVRKS